MLKNKSEEIKKMVLACSAILGFLVVWQLLIMTETLGKILPGPISTIQLLIYSMTNKIGNNTIWGHILWSFSRSMTGFFMGSFLGISLGLLMGRYKLIRAIIRPFTEMIRPVPPIAWISLAILWFGLGEFMKYFIIFIAVFNNMCINTYMGYQSVDQELLGVGRMLGASEAALFKTVILPATVPYIFAGAHVGIATSWAAVVAAEMVRSSEGLGWMVVAGMDINDVQQILVGVMAIAIVGFLLAAGMRKLEDKLCEWNVRGV